MKPAVGVDVVPRVNSRVSVIGHAEQDNGCLQVALNVWDEGIDPEDLFTLASLFESLAKVARDRANQELRSRREAH